MKAAGRLVAVLILVGIVGGCRDQSPRAAGTPDGAAAGTAALKRVRGMAAAGLYYPRHRDDLALAVDRLLGEANPPPIERLRALVCPHGTYESSGATAALAYKLLAGRDVHTVVLMAPSHRATFAGAWIPDADAYETPLGMVPIAPWAGGARGRGPFEVATGFQVTRPPRDQWLAAPKELPAFGDETPGTWEYANEVQLPFLQRTLNDVAIVPILFGDPSAAEETADRVAEALLEHLNDTTLLVATSNLSEHCDEETAKGRDATCCEAICSLNTEWTRRQEACGIGPLLTLLHIAREKGWKARLLDYRTVADPAADTSAGTPADALGGVTGYAAIAFYEPLATEVAEDIPRPIGPTPLGPDERQSLLTLVRQTLTAFVGRRQALQINDKDLPDRLTSPGACYVCLTKDGQLRGRAGSVFPQRPLYQAAVFAAMDAAVAVTPDELDRIEVEILLPTVPTPLEFRSPDELLAKLRPGVDGVVLRVGPLEATGLPQGWQEKPDPAEFLSQTAADSGLARSRWRDADAQVLVFQVESVRESAEEGNRSTAEAP